MKTNTEYGLVTERREEKVIIKHLKQFLANDKRTISKIKNPSLLESKLPFKYKYFYFNLNKEMGTYIALFPNRDEDSNYKYPDNKEGFCCKVSYMKLHSRKQDLGESDMRYFKGKQFKKDIILVAVGYYCRFSLSYRDVSEILKERVISVHPTTIMRWVHEYGNLIYQIWKVKNKSARLSWHLDETYIKVKGEWRYLYRAIDKDGHTLDIQLRKKRDHQAAYAFMKRLVKHFGKPTVLTTDKAPALLCAFKKLKKNGFYVRTKHCTVKYLNNLIEQDHRHVKRRFAKSAGFQNLRHASRTIKGIETIQAIYKQRRSLESDSVFSVYKELQQLVAIA